MLVYNITFNVEESVNEEALSYLRRRYIPEAQRSGLLTLPRFCRIRNSYSGEGSNYSIQFYVKDERDLDRWLSGRGNVLGEELKKLFQEKVLNFETLMDELDMEEGC